MQRGERTFSYYGVTFETSITDKGSRCRHCGGWISAKSRKAHVPGRAVDGHKCIDGHVNCVRRRIRDIRTS